MAIGTDPYTTETKALGAPGQASELKSAFGDFLKAFESFKEANDERLAQIESKQTADCLTEEKVSRINESLTGYQRQIADLATLVTRPEHGAGHQLAEDRKAFRTFLRTGAEGRALISEEKALSGSSGAEGGYLLPTEIETMVDRSLAHVTPMRRIASVRQIGAGTLKKPFATSAAATGWVGETAARPETNTPTLAEIEFPTSELYAMPAASVALLDDASADVESWLAEEIQTVFAEQEGTAFVSGTGTNQPTGFLSYTEVADASWSWGNIGYIATGVDGAFAATNPTDELINLVYAPKQAYRANANWVMNRKTEAAIRQFKDGDGNYIWKPGADAGQAASLMGYPIVESEDMPDIASGSTSIAFGDFRRGYLIVDRVGIRILRDPYSAKPYVLFYATKRVGGGVQDFAAIKLLKFSVS